MQKLQEPAAPRRDVAQTFARLAREWKARKSHSSCVEDMALDMAYQQIIGLGPPVIPFILAELERDPDHWFWALHAITQANPVPDASRGRVAAMSEAWLDWGRNQWYRW